MGNKYAIYIGTATVVIGVIALLTGWVLLSYGMVSGSGTRSYESEGPLLYAVGTVLIVLGVALCIVGIFAGRFRRKNSPCLTSSVEMEE